MQVKTQPMYYDILGLNQDATKSVVKQAFKMAAQKYHPDKGGSPYLASKINEAKDFLNK